MCFNYVDPIQSIWSQVKYSARVYVYLVFPNGELREIESLGGKLRRSKYTYVSHLIVENNEESWNLWTPKHMICP